MTNEQRKNSLSKIQQAAASRQQLVPTEYTNYDEYMDAQSRITKHLTSQPARTCEMCGYPMDYNGHQLSEREQKWSVHDVCQAKVESMLDRQTGIARERLEIERRADRHRRRQHTE